jgi:hypothetical protein
MTQQHTEAEFGGRRKNGFAVTFVAGFQIAAEVNLVSECRPGQDSELFFGYYLPAATMAAEEHGPPVPELARRMTLTSCHTDPARALVPVLQRLAAGGVPLGDVLADSGMPTEPPGAGRFRCAPPAPPSSKISTRRPRPPWHTPRRHHR